MYSTKILYFAVPGKKKTEITLGNAIDPRQNNKPKIEIYLFENFKNIEKHPDPIVQQKDEYAKYLTYFFRNK